MAKTRRSRAIASANHRMGASGARGSDNPPRFRGSPLPLRTPGIRREQRNAIGPRLTALSRIEFGVGQPAREFFEVERLLLSIPNRLHSVPNDPVDQLRIRQARLARREREVFVLREMGIW